VSLWFRKYRSDYFVSQNLQVFWWSVSLFDRTRNAHRAYPNGAERLNYLKIFNVLKDWSSQTTFIWNNEIFGYFIYLLHRYYHGIKYFISCSCFNRLPNKKQEFTRWRRWLEKPLWEKEKLLILNNFSFYHNDLFPTRGVSSNLIYFFYIAICNFFQIWTVLKLSFCKD